MVGVSDLKVYKTTNNLGGAITGTQINSATPNNLFTNIPKNELVVGEDYYGCCYFKNTHSTESMDAFKLWLTSKTPPTDTELKWGFDPLVYSQPSIFFDGTNDYIDCTNDSELWSQALTKFSFLFYIFPTVGWDGNDRFVLRHGTGAQSFHCYIPSATSGKIVFQIRNAADTPIEAFSTGLILNQWNLVVCVYDSTLGSANLKIYVNNVVGGTTANLTETINQSATLTLSDNSTDYQGSMIQYLFWKSTALSAANIDTIFNGSLNSVTLPDYWLKMNEGTGNTLDVVSGTKTGTLSGATWNTNAQTIADKYTSPLGVTWKTLSSEPSTANFAKINAGVSFPIWLWLHVNANAVSRLDDAGLFNFNFNIPQGGTGDTGGGAGGGGSGGTGGNPPPTNTNYKIAFVGDEGCENETDDVIDLIDTENYDYVVSVGDHAYAGASCWTNRFGVLKPNFNSAYGNHEYSESGGTSPYKTFFGHSLTYFTFQFQNIFFLVIDTNINSDVGSTQHNFFVSELNRVANDSTITWKIAVMHHPAYGASSNNSYNEFQQRQNFHTLFQTNKVSFWVAGHNHNTQRTHQIAYNSASSGSPVVVDNTSPYDRNAIGLIHVVTGVGGHDSGSGLYSLGSQPSYQAYQARNYNGVWEIVASNNAQTLTCSFVDISSNKYDTFVITA